MSAVELATKSAKSAKTAWVIFSTAGKPVFVSNIRHRRGAVIEYCQSLIKMGYYRESRAIWGLGGIWSEKHKDGMRAAYCEVTECSDGLFSWPEFKEIDAPQKLTFVNGLTGIKSEVAA